MKIADVNREELSTAMQQYYDIKKQHMDKVVLFQLGDFYEMFFDDALHVSNLLELTLTSKAAGLDEKVPMAGVPMSTLEDYLAKLIAQNESVVVVSQDDADQTTKVITRKITKIVTPGTYYSATDLDNKYSGVVVSKDKYYLSYGDINTGQMFYSIFETNDQLIQEIVALQIKEVIDLNDCLKNNHVELEYHNINLIKHDITVDYTIDGILIVQSNLVEYFKSLTQNSVEHLRNFELVDKNNILKMSIYTQNHLELTKTINEQQYVGSLFWYLNRTSTAMGRRRLKELVIHPYTNDESINKSLNIVEQLTNNTILLDKLKQLLNEIYDFERLISKISSASILPKEVVQLNKSITNLPKLVELCYSNKYLEHIFSNCIDLQQLNEYLTNALIEEPSNNFKEGGIISDSFNADVKELRQLRDNSTQWLANYEQKQIELTGIKTLKVKYNKVFGYFIEVRNASLNLVPENYIRKQTMATCERYITSELKEKEDDILNAADRLLSLEITLFNEIRAHLKEYISVLATWASSISNIDLMCSFATLTLENNLTRPQFNNENKIEVVDGFHPIVKKVSKKYINNGINLDDECNILLITGPNMAGKSTYMRQITLTIIMAQMGCYVPAAKANLMIHDQIFTRIGASDDLTGGRSTFMVEMSETAFALNNATEKSLLIFDELGRGTSTYDGMALAQSVIEYIDEKLKCKTLFSTHYHELTVLSVQINKLKNVHVYAEKVNDTLVFHHKVSEGAVQKSYGIDVAKLANLPYGVIKRARNVIIELEANHTHVAQKSEESEEFVDERITDISQVDVNNLSPLEALIKLQQIVDMCKE